MGLIPPKYLWEDKGMSSNTGILELMSSLSMEPKKDSYGLIYYRPIETDKVITGQYKQEINIWKRQILPVKVFKYLRTKIK